MHFLDDSLFPENQQKLIIKAAPYGPQWTPSCSEDVPLSMDAQVQKAVDCWNAGASALHIHVREADGKGSRRMSMFNELLARLREAVPEMLLQVGGSISFAPEGEGEEASWPSYDARHMLAELDPKPDQVTIAIGTSQMSITEMLTDPADYQGTVLEKQEYFAAYSEMISDARPSFYLEHLQRLAAKEIQPHFMLGHVHQLETVERLIRAGLYQGPLNLNYVAIGGGAAGYNPADLIEFARRTPDGAVLTINSGMRNVLPFNTIAIALGLHVRVGIEDNLWGKRGQRATSVEQIEQMVRISTELGRDIATGAEAREIYKIGQTYTSTDQTLANLGMAPNRKPGQRGFTIPGQF